MTLLSDYLNLLPATEADKRFVDKSLQLSGLISSAMQRQGLTQRALADLLNKKESEVSRWLSGLHNFTLKTITRLEAVLGDDLVLAFRDTQKPAVMRAMPGSRRTATASQWTEESFQHAAQPMPVGAATPLNGQIPVPPYADAA